MKFGLNKIVLILIVTFLAACEKTVFFDVETKENRLVVNAFIQPDSLNRAIVSLSVDPLAVGFESERVGDASVNIKKNNINLGNYHHDFNGEYSISDGILQAEAGDEFELTISAPDKETVTAYTKIPDLVEIVSAAIIDTFTTMISYSYIDEFGNIIYVDTLVPYYKVALTFNDLNSEDYYSLTIRYRDAFGQALACVSTSDPIFTVNDDYNFGGENDENTATFCDEVMFSDVTFNGTVKTIELSIYALNTTFLEDPKFEFDLKHLSKSYYQYVTTSRLQLENEGNPFGEPVIIYSNIENGFGIFAGFSMHRAIIAL